MMDEVLDILKDVASRLEKADIKYMITGSMTMTFYSAPRMTRDIDIVIHVAVSDIERIVALFRNDFYIDEISVRQAVQDKGMFNVIHNKLAIKIDFIVRKNEAYRIEEFSRRRTVDIEGIPISVVTPEDLILSKLVWVKLSESELQFRDVRQIISALGNIDIGYLEKWSRELGVEDLLRKAQEHE